MSNGQAPPFVVAYDLADDRERRSVARLLGGYGFRTQFSVWECRLTRADQRRLKQRLEALPLTSGAVKIYRLYDGARHLSFGARASARSPDECHAFLA